jgi:hypothetical protein
MSSARNKTLRATESDGPQIDYSRNDSMETMLNAEAGQVFKKPWHRLERGLRLNRLRAFSESLAAARGLKTAEQSALMDVLTRALDRKALNSKLAVTYDPEKEQVTEIKSLVMHQNASGEVLFKILERRSGVTFRKKGGATAAATAEEASATTV